MAEIRYPLVPRVRTRQCKMLELLNPLPADRLSSIVPVPVKKIISATSEPAAPAKVGFVSLGCTKNLVDSEVMMGMLAQAGAELTSHAEEADVIVVNTCSFIGSAQQE